MGTEYRLNRAKFLRVSAAAAVGAAVTACVPGQPAGGPAPEARPGTTPAPGAPGGAVPAPGKFKEAPMLADLVKQGKLPPVEQRLPQNPYVVPHKWLTAGKYGGKFDVLVQSGDDSGTTRVIQTMMYGHSPLRWLRDGLEIGPGLVEKWETNADGSTWTLHFRKGLKWSDGKPWSVDDVLFWWEDEVQNPDLKESPPDEARSGKNTLMTLKKVDETTLQMVFDAPAPLTADRLAMWVNRGIGPRWMDPKHYLAQFHPKYNPAVDKTNWVETFLDKRGFKDSGHANPDSPTMTGWMLQSYTQGQNSVWVRNPYYYAIDKDGNQLPFVDRVTITNVQDPEVWKLRASQGAADIVGPQYAPFTLADISTFRNAEAQSGMEVRLWDSGSGTGSLYYFNYDYFEPKLRALFRMPKFRQAMSLAYNRAEAQRSIYFNQGELTTGTLSPKALEYNINDEGKRVYQQWRDSYVKHDPEQAKRLLDEIGVKDVNGDGWREMPDGSPLKITIDYPADIRPTGEHMLKNELLVRDWKAIGINAELNPVTPTSRMDQWRAGQLMTRPDWEVGDGPNHLVFPQWLVPLEADRWAPLEGQFYNQRGTPKEFEERDADPYRRTPPRMEPEPGGPIEKLWQLYDQSKVEPDQMKRVRLVWDMIKIHIEHGPFFSGTAANPPRIFLVRKGIRNVPKKEDLALGGFVNPWIHPTPAVYDPETWHWDNPEQHR